MPAPKIAPCHACGATGPVFHHPCQLEAVHRICASCWRKVAKPEPVRNRPGKKDPLPGQMELPLMES
ncbi:MAG: hypothetical protein ACYTAO_17770 [Planctomycetota bacterium]|jgi:hypothetical protein